MRKSRDDVCVQSIQKLMRQLTEFGKGQTEHQAIDFSYVPELCCHIKKIFSEQQTLLDIYAPIKVVGSVMGHLDGLIKVLQFAGEPSQTCYLFLGNYINRGPNSLQTILLLFCYKLCCPGTFFMLRGRHESTYMSKIYGFYDECKRKGKLQLWKQICDTFNIMPYAAIIDYKIFCVSGGISPQLQNLQQLEKLQKGLETPHEGLICDIVWSQPSRLEAGFEKHIQGISYSYGRESVERFFLLTETQLIVRSNQVLPEGYQLMFDNRLINLFSAPAFLGKYANSAGILTITSELMLQFMVYKPKAVQQTLTKFYLS